MRVDPFCGAVPSGGPLAGEWTFGLSIPEAERCDARDFLFFPLLLARIHAAPATLQTLPSAVQCYLNASKICLLLIVQALCPFKSTSCPHPASASVAGGAVAALTSMDPMAWTGAVSDAPNRPPTGEMTLAKKELRCQGSAFN